MKYLKMLGLAAVAAAALMAFAGAGTASASEICTEKVNPCPAAKKITKIEASLIGGTAKLEDTEKNVLDTCTGGGVKITNITGGAGVSPTGTVPKEDLTWSGCTFTTNTVTGGTIDATEATGGGTTLTATGFEVTILNPIGSCTYGVGTGLDLGTVAPGGTELAINKVVKLTAGVFCPSTAVWNATYKVTNHTAVWFIKN
jgi:hypothetical protein